MHYRHIVRFPRKWRREGFVPSAVSGSRAARSVEAARDANAEPQTRKLAEREGFEPSVSLWIHKSLGYFPKYAWRNSSITGGSVP